MLNPRRIDQALTQAGAGLSRRAFVTTSVGGAVGITGELAGWNLAAYLSGGRETTGLTASNRVQTTRLDEALASRERFGG